MTKRFMTKSAMVLSVLALASIAQVSFADEQADTTNSNTVATTETAAQPTTTNEVATPATTATETPATSTDTSSTATPTPAVTAPATDAASEATDKQPVEGESVNMRIMSTTDLHTNLVNYDYYQDKEVQNIGLAKTAVLMTAAQAENPNTVLLDNGDTIQGTPLGTYEAIINPVKPGEQHPMYQAFTTLKYDVGSLGNHEFNYGLPYLTELVKSAGLPIVNANVIDDRTNKPYFTPYKIVTKTFTDTNGRQVNLKVGITGIVPPQVMEWDKANLSGKVHAIDGVEAVEGIVPLMRQDGADVVIVMSHSGIGDEHYDAGEENVGYQLAGIAGVDAVVTGHAHAEFPSGNGTGYYEKIPGVDGINGKINGIPVTMGGKYGDHLGIIDLGLTYKDGKWQVSNSHAEIRKIDTKSDVADQRILDIAKEANEGTIQYVRQQVGTTTAPINSYFALVQDDPSVQIVNNAQRWYVSQELAGTDEAKLPLLSAAAPFKAGSRSDATSYTDIPAGPIAIKNVADLYLYDNVTAVLKLTGKDLKEWLEMSAGQFNQIDPNTTAPQQLINPEYRTYNFDIIDGVTYNYDVTQPNKYDIDGNLVNPTASRVRDLMFDGKPVTDDQEFMVVTNNYRASGNFPGVKNASVNRLLNLENRQAIINYITSVKTINPSADNNWHFADTIKGLDVHFRTADRAKDLLSNNTNIAYVGPDDVEGFGDFKLVDVTPSDNTQPTTPTASTPKTAAHKLTTQKHQAIVATVATAYAKTLASQHQETTTKTAQLPQTGDKASATASILGLISLGFAGLLGRSTVKSRQK